MPQQDDGTAEMEETEEVVCMIFPADDEPSEVMQPGKQAFDLPSFAVAAQDAAIVKAGTGASTTVWGNQQHLVFEQFLAQRIAVVGAVTTPVRTHRSRSPRTSSTVPPNSG